MSQYIPKEPLVAEIDRRLGELYKLLPDASKAENEIITISKACNIGKHAALESFKDYVDTLEVKEVNLEKSISDWLLEGLPNDDELIDHIKETAKHFFELGMCAANPLTVKDIKKIYHLVNEVSDDLGVRAMYVNIYQEALKRFKANKGE
jgi:hypothetical protein